jgi:glutaredoxin
MSGERRLDPEHHLAVARVWRRDIVDAEVARPVQSQRSQVVYRTAVALKLHRCSNIWVKVQAHPCWKVQSALDEADIEYEVVKEPLFKGKRDDLEKVSGQRQLPVIEFEDGSFYRAESKEMAETIKAGKLDEKRGAATEATPSG